MANKIEGFFIRDQFIPKKWKRILVHQLPQDPTNEIIEQICRHILL